MNRYKLTFILRDGSKIKINTEEISEELLMERIRIIRSSKAPLIIKDGTIKHNFLAVDIKKIKYKVLEYE